MITRTETVTDIEPIYRDYLAYMSRFFNIMHYDPWCAAAFKNLQRYAVEAGRYIYIQKNADEVAGFALINKHLRFNTDGFAMAEFFIQTDCRGKGYGRKLAEHVFADFPGCWEVAVTSENKIALKFWEQVILSFTGNHFSKKRHPSFDGYGFIFNADS